MKQTELIKDKPVKTDCTNKCKACLYTNKEEINESICCICPYNDVCPLYTPEGDCIQE
jgi:hypothetical protein